MKSILQLTRGLAAILLAVLCSPGSLPAASLIWDTTIAADGTITGGAGTWTDGAGSWNSGTTSVGINWNNATPDSAIFGDTAGTVTLGGAVTVGDMTFNTSGYIISGGNLTLSNSTINTNAAVTISAGLGGTTGLIKAGTGTLTLSGANTFTGNVTVSSGTLEIAGTSTILNSANASTVTIASGATALLSGTADNALGYGHGSAEQWVVAGTVNSTGGAAQSLPYGGVTLNGGTLTSSSGNAPFGSYYANGLQGVVTANGTGNTISAVDVGIEVGATLILSTPLVGDTLTASAIFKEKDGVGNLAKTGAGTVTLSGANTYTGTTTISGGTLNLSGAGNANSSNIAISGSSNLTFTATDGRSFTKAITGTAGNISFNVAGNTSDSGGGDATSFGMSNTGAFTGTVVVNTGLVSASSNSAFGNTANVIQLNAASGQSAGLMGNGLTLASTRAIQLTQAGGNSVFRAFNGNTFQIDGQISGAGNLVKTDGGTLTLTGANTFTGTTRVGGGVLNIQNADALGTTAAGTSVTSGAALQIQGSITTAAEALSLNGTGVSTDGALRNISGTNSYAGLVTLGSASRINSDSGTLTLSNTGTITGAGLALTVGGAGDTTINSIIGTTTGTLTKDGAGKLTLTGANTYTGGTNVSAGSIILGNQNGFGTGTVTLAGGVNFSTSGFEGNSAGGALPNALVLSGGMVNVDVSFGAKDIWINTGVSGTGGFSVTGAGAIMRHPGLMLSGANTFQGGVTIADQTRVSIDNNTSLGTGGLRAASGTGTLRVSGNVSNVANSVVVASGATLNVEVDSGIGGLLSGVISSEGAGGSLTKSDTGTLTLTGANTYTGATTVSAGALNIQNAAALGTTAAGTSVTSGAALQIQGTITTSAEALTLNGTGISNDGALRNISNNNSYAGLVTLGSDTRINSDSGTLTLSNTGTITGAGLGLTVGGAGTTEIRGIIGTGTGTLTKDGAGALVLKGANTYTGTTTISAGQLVIGNNSATGSLSPSSAIINNSTLVFSRSNTITQGTDFASVISGSGVVNQNSTGTLILNGANSYTGTTSVNAGGVLNIQHANALGGTAAGTAVLSGAALQIQGDITTAAEALNLRGTGISSDGALRNISGSNNFAGLVTLASATRINSDAGTLTLSNAGTITGVFGLTVGGAGNTTINSIIGTGTGTLSKDGAGTLTLSGTNTYTGATTITAGTLSVGTIGNGGVAGNLGQASSAAGNMVFDGGTLQYTGSNATSDRAFTINTGKTATIDTANNLTLVGATGTATNGALTKTGAGTLTLTGTSTNTGTTTISAGTLQIGNGGTAGALATGSAITNNATLAFNRSDTITQGTNFASVISGSGAVTQAGSGTLVLSGANTYTGATTVSTGVLNIQNAAALGTTAAGTSVTSGAALQIQGDITTAAEALTLNGTGVSTDGALRNISGTNDFAGLVALGSDARINSDSGTLTLSNTGTINSAGRALTVGGAGNTTIASIIGTGSGTLTKDGAGTLTLTGANTYTGATTISAGTVALSGGGRLADTTAVNLSGATGILDISAINTTIEAIGSLAGVASSSVVLGTKNLQVGNANDTSFAGAISGTGSLIKVGSGKLTLSGTNTYNGSQATQVRVGTLEVATGGSISHSSSSLIVGISGSSGTLNITGGSVSNDAGTLGGDTNSIGTANVSAGTWTNSSNLSVGVNGTGVINLTGGTVHVGGVAGTGTVTLGSSGTLNIGTGTTVGTLNAAAVTSASGTAVVNFNHTGSVTFAPLLTGSLSVNKLAAGTTILSNTNTYTGATTISAGTLSVATIGNGGVAGNLGQATSAAGNLVFDGGTLQYTGSTATSDRAFTINAAKTATINTANGLTLAGATGTATTGALTKTGAGTLTLTGTSTNTGATTISAGTLQIGNGSTTGALASGSAITNNATLAFNRSNTITQGTDFGTISGSGAVTQAGGGLLILNGTNSYSGVTTVSAGILRLNSAGALPGGIGTSGGTSALTLSGGVIGLGAGDFTRGLGTGVTQVQWTGNGGFAAYGADRVVNLGGAGATVTWGSGSFVPNGSALILGAADATNKVTFQNAIDFGGATRTIQVVRGSSVTYDAKLGGALSNGSYTQTGDGRLELTGAISGTSYDQSATNGSLALTSTISTTTFTQSGVGSTTTVSGAGSISSPTINLNAGTTTLSNAGTNTALTTDGNAGTGNDVTINGGALVIGASEQIGNNGSLVLTTGSFGFTGSGLTETIGTFTNNGGTFSTGANTLKGTGATVTWAAGTNTVNDGGNVQDAHIVISGGTNTVEGGATGGVLQLLTGGLGLEMSAGSTLTLNSDNAVAGKLLLQGDVSITGDSTVTIASGLALTNKGNVDLSSGTRIFTVADGLAADDLLVGAVITNGSLTKSGAGTMNLAGLNTYTGTTTVTAGTLSISGDINSSATLSISGGVLSTTGANKLADAAAVTVGGGTLTIGGNDTVGTLTMSSGVIGGSATLTATTYGLSGGTVTGNLGTGTINSSGTVALNGTAGATVVNVTAGNLSLGAASAINSATTVGISGGSLTLGASNQIGNATVTVSGGILAMGGNSDTVSIFNLSSGSISGSGTLTATTYGLSGGTVTANLGTGTINSSGTVALNGTAGATAVNVTAGNLTLGAASAINSATTVGISGGSLTLGASDQIGNATVTVSGGILAMGGNSDTVSIFNLSSGSISGSGTLTATTYGLSGGTVTANLGTGTINSSGTVALNGTAGATAVNVTAGNLTLGAASAINSATTVDISGGSLTLGASDQIGNATVTVSGGILAMGANTDTVSIFNLSSGSISGSGTLTATTYGLSGGTVTANLGTGTINSSGTVALNGTAGATVVNVTAGTLTLGSANRLADGATVAVSGGILDVSTFTDTVSIFNLSAGSLNGSGAGTLTATTYGLSGGTVNGKLGTGTINSSGTVALNGTAGATVVNVTAGNLTLGAASAINSATTVGISGGSLTLGASNQIGNATVTVSGGILAMGGNSDTVSIFNLSSGSISGSGTLTATTYGLSGGTVTANLGTGTINSSGTVALNGTAGATVVNVTAGNLTLGAASAINSATTVGISGGSLTLGASNQIGNATVTVSGGILAMGANSDTVSIFNLSSGSISGSGTLTATTYGLSGGTVTANLGTGTINSSGTVALNGTAGATAVNITAGTLTLGSANRLADGATVTVSGTGILDVSTFTDTVSIFNLSAGSLNGSGTLTATTYGLSGGTVTANLGTGTINSSGTVALNGTAGATVVNVTAGTLTLGANDRLADGATVTVSGGTLGMSTRTDTVSIFNMSSGSITGSGTLTATTYGLSGGTVTANLGTGTINSSGTVALNGTAGATAVNVTAGNLTLGAASAINSATTVDISGGSLTLGASDQIGNATVTVSGGILAMGANTDTVSIFNLSSGSISGSGTLTATTYGLSGGTVTANLGTGTINSSGTVALNGTAGATAVNVTAGNLTLGAASAINSATTVGISGGSLTLGASDQIGNATVTVSGGILAMGGNSDTVGAVVLTSGSITGSGGVLTSTTTYDVRTGSVSAILGGSVGLTKTTAGTVTLSGANTYSGATTISAGTLALSGAGALSDSSAVNVNGATGIFDISGISASGETIGSLAGVASSSVVLGAKNLTAGGDGTSTIFTGAISGTGGTLTKAGTGTLTLNSANSYTGLTTVSAGILNIQNATGLGTTAGGTSVSNGATLQLQGNITVGAEALSLNGGAAAGQSGALVNVSGTNSYGGAITVTSSSSISAASGSVLNLTGGVVKNGTVATFNGGGTINVGTVGISGASANSDLVIDGTVVNLDVANTYNGPTFIRNSGTLNANVVGALPTATRTALTFDGTGTSVLTLGAAQSVASLTAASTATITLNANTLTVGDASSNTTFAGAIGGTGGLTKDGASTQVLSASNGYSGTTTVSAGTLSITGDINSSATLSISGGLLSTSGADKLANTAAVTVSGGTLTVGGADTVSTLTTSGSGSTIGGSSTLTATTYTLGGSSTVVTGNLGAGTINSSGTVALNGTAGALAVNVTAGTLTLGANDRLDDGATVTVSGGALGMSTRTDTVSIFNMSSGSITGSGTLTATTYGLSGGTVTANLGTGTINSSGTVALNGTAGALAVNVTAGTLTLGSANRLADGATVAVSGGILDVSTFTDTVSIFNLSAGTLNGSGAGTLTATTYGLSGGTVNGKLGTGTINSSGTVALNGTAGATVVNVTAGNLTLGAASAINSATTVDISGGSLTLGASNQIGNATVTVSGGILAMGGNSDTVSIFNLSSGSISGSGTLTATTYGLSGGTVTANLGTGTINSSGTVALNGTAGATAVNITAGTLTLGANNRLADGATVTVSGGTLGMSTFTDTVSIFNMSSGSISGSGTLTATTYGLSGGTVDANLGTGTLNSSGAVALNGTAGATAVNVTAGTLTLGSSDRLANGATVTVSGGTLAMGANTDTVSIFNMSSGSITGSGTLTATTYGLSGGTVDANLGTGTLQSSGNVALNGTSAATFVNITAGTLTLGSSNRLADTAAVVLTSGGSVTLDLGANNETVGSVTLVRGTINGSGTLTSGTTFDIRRGDVNAILGGSVGLTKTTTALVTLTNANTYTGTTTVSDGTLGLSGAGRLSDSSSVVVNGGTFDIGSVSDTVAGVQLTSGSITGTSGVLTSSSTYDMQSGSVSAILGGSVGLTKTTGGTVTLTNANTYTGTTTVSAGTLALSGAGRLSDSSSLVVNGGTYDIGTVSDTVAGVQLTSGSITGTTGVLTSSSTYDVQAGSVSAILGGTVGLTKTTAGTVTLSGTNSYSGATLLSAGTLVVDGSIGSSSLTTLNGGTLQGTGTVSAIQLNSGGAINPGLTATAGTLNTGSIAIVDGQLQFNLGGTGVGQYDQINTTGTINLTSGGTGAKLVLDAISGYTATLNDAFTLVSNDLTDAISGAFAKGTFGGTKIVTISGLDYVEGLLGSAYYGRINYAGSSAAPGTLATSGNDIVLKVVTPEITVTEGATNLLDGGTYDFGDVDKVVPAIPLTKTFTIKNDGEVDLMNIAITGPTGGQSVDYTINTTGTATNLTPGASTTYTVTFDPSRIGTRTTTMAITSNDLNEASFDITLTGVGSVGRDLIADGLLPTDSWAVHYNGVDAPATMRNGNANAVVVQNSTTKDEAVAVFATGYTTNAAGNKDLYLTKYDPNTGAEMWAAPVIVDGGVGRDDEGLAVAVDASGDVVVAGYQTVGLGNTDAYVAKFNGADGSLAWSKTYSGAGGGNDAAVSLALDSSGNVAVAGYGRNGAANQDVFMARYLANGTEVFAVLIDGGMSRTDGANTVAMDASGVYAAGYRNVAAGNKDCYIIKLDSTGGYLWEQTFAGTSVTTGSDDEVYSMALDSSGNVFLAGTMYNSTGYDTYVAKLNSSGVLQWQKTDDPYGFNDSYRSVLVDSAGNIVVAGVSHVTATTTQRYVSKYTTAGVLVWNARMNTANDTAGNLWTGGIALDAENNVVVTGFSVNGGGTRDVYTTKLKYRDGSQLWERTYDGGVAGGANDEGRAVAVSPDGYVYVAGYAGVDGGTTAFLVKHYKPRTAPVQTAQTITFPTLAEQGSGGQVTLVATATSGLRVRFNVVSGPGALSGPNNDLLTFTGVGTVVVRASQSGNFEYAPAANVDQSMVITKQAQTIAFTMSASVYYSSTVVLAGTASSGLAVTYSVVNDPSGVASIAGTNLTFTGPGFVTVRASQAGNGTYVAATNVDVTIEATNTPPVIIPSDIAERWVKSYAGTGAGVGRAVALKPASGEATAAVMTGYTTTASGGRDIYTVQYSANGTQDWAAVYSGAGVLADEGAAVTVDAAGNVYVAGYTTISGANTDLIVIMYNSSGTQQWVRTFAGSTASGADAATSLALAGSDIVVAGYLTNVTRDFFAAKITSANSVTWQNSYDAGAIEGGTGKADTANKLAVDSSGNIALVGNAAGVSNGIDDIWTVKLNSSGTRVWYKRYNGSLNREDRGAGVGFDSVGNVLITGWTNGQASVSTYDIYTAKYASADGALAWQTIYNHSDNLNDSARDLKVDSNGSAVVVGVSNNLLGNQDIWTGKFDGQTGTLAWFNRYNNVRIDQGVSVSLDPNGNVITTGSSGDIDGTTDIYTVKYNTTTGGTIWTQRYEGLNGRNDAPSMVAADSAGSVYVAGYQTNSSGVTEAMLVRYAPASVLPPPPLPAPPPAVLAENGSEVIAYAAAPPPPQTAGLQLFLTVEHGDLAHFGAEFMDAEGNDTVGFSAVIDGNAGGSLTIDTQAGLFTWEHDTSTIAPGAHEVVITATDTAGASTSVNLAVTVISSYPDRTWRWENFGSTVASGNAADDADPDGDGLSNLSEFAFGLNPTRASSDVGNRVEASSVGQTSSGMRAVFRRRKDYATAGLGYVVEFSNNLVDWTPSAAIPEFIADEGILEKIGIDFPVLPNGMQSQFFRIQVQQQNAASQ